MSKKRILSLLLASSLVVTAFVGCGSKSEGNGGSNSSSSSSDIDDEQVLNTIYFNVATLIMGL